MSTDQGIQLRSVNDLIGHTIKTVIQNTHGKRSAGLLIVTESDCWLALDAENDGDAAIIEVSPGYGSDIPLGDYLSAHDAFTHGLINKPTHDLLVEREEAARAEWKKRKAENLRKQLVDLEGEAP